MAVLFVLLREEKRERKLSEKTAKEYTNEEHIITDLSADAAGLMSAGGHDAVVAAADLMRGASEDAKR